MDRQFLYALKANNFIISVVMIHKTNTGGCHGCVLVEIWNIGSQTSSRYTQIVLRELVILRRKENGD